ncbi:MAG: hypothetical protein M0R80_04995 [Proteobacteria bacterium]|nr:hypothetical protein [Pseudomonadota bacterium]
MRLTHLISLSLALVTLCGCQGDPAGTGEQPDGGTGSSDADTDTDTDSDSSTDEPPVVGCGDLIQEEPGELPDRVIFREKKRSFNLRWYVVLRDGAIWVKPNDEQGQPPGDWILTSGGGKPEGGDLDNFGVPVAVEEITCDGVHLTALSDAEHFYRGTDMTTDISSDIIWTDAWGGLLGNGPGLSAEFSTRCGWSVADSHPFGVDHYEDTNGTQHGVGAGVAHLYRLSEDGYDIHFNDWWLPEDWSRQICGPERGTFRAVNISASASTMFLVGEQGRLYTRLYDFDTGGENSLLTYSYVIEGASGTTRKLPAESWRPQPDPPGRITPRITIFQDGQGNAARVLRVEGTMGEIDGYFEKRIYDENWIFHETGNVIQGPFLDEGGVSNPREPADFPLAGTLSVSGTELGLELLDLNMVCSPARARLFWQGEIVTVGGEELLLEFHHVNTMVDTTRPVAFWKQSIAAEVQAALILPSALEEIDDDDARAAVEGFFGDREVVNFLGTISPEGADLSEIMWNQPFRVPAEEKAMLNPVVMHLAP